MSFLLLILGFFATANIAYATPYTDSLQAIEHMLTDNTLVTNQTLGKNIPVDHSETMQSVVFNPRVPNREATNREVILVIQALRYIDANTNWSKWSEMTNGLKRTINPNPQTHEDFANNVEAEANNRNVEAYKQHKKAEIDNRVGRIKRSLLSRQRPDWQILYAIFSYLPHKNSPNKSNITTAIARDTSMDPTEVGQLLTALDQLLPIIDQKQQATLIKIGGEDGVGLVKDPTADLATAGNTGDRFESNQFLKRAARGAGNEAVMRDYRTTQRLVTFAFDAHNNVTGCINPEMKEFAYNPFAVYRRPPAPVGMGLDYLARDPNLRINQFPTFLYNILLEDDRGDQVIYGVPNPADFYVESARGKIDNRQREKLGELVQLSQTLTGTISPVMRTKKEAVENFIQNNHYFLYDIQHLDSRSVVALNNQRSEPEVVLRDVHLPMLRYLSGQGGFLTEAAAGFEIPATFPTFDHNNRFSGGYLHNDKVQISHFKDLNLSQYYEAIGSAYGVQDVEAEINNTVGEISQKEDRIAVLRPEIAALEAQIAEIGTQIAVLRARITSEYNTAIRSRSQVAMDRFDDSKRSLEYQIDDHQYYKASLERELNNKKNEIEVNNKSIMTLNQHINRFRPLLVGWPKFYVIESNVPANRRGDNRSDPLYVLKVLYRWDSAAKELVQISMGIPELSIMDRKVSLEEHLKRAER